MTPKLVGLTGGIGSGKTTITKFFEELGVPIYIADVEAKALMKRSKIIKRKLIQLFGKDAYIKNELNKPLIASIIFSDKEMLEKMNAIIHPRVARHFEKWVKKQDSPYVINEVAILFENNTYKKYDYIITVVAPEKLRIERVILRDNSTPEKVKAIIDNQLSDAEKIEKSDFVIENINLEDTRKKVHKVHKKLLKTNIS